MLFLFGRVILINKFTNIDIISMKFRLIKDLVLNTGFEEEVILNKGEIIEDTNGEYFFAKLNKVYTKEDLLYSRKNLLFIFANVMCNKN